MADGGYGAANGARSAPVHKKASDGQTLGEDFPMLCETCLGPNPYVRMTKTPYGDKLCKISVMPFQSFRWKAGPGGRYKETIISIAVAKDRNICQTCLNDMKYGLPVGVRDALLKQAEGDTAIAMPMSDVGQRYFYEQQAQLVDGYSSNGQAGVSTDLANVPAVRQLDKFSRVLQVAEAKSKTAFRNLPKLCSFWLAGTCTRVLRKTCPYRPCCGTFVFPEIAGNGENKAICDKLMDALKKDGAAVVMKTIDAETRTAFQQSMRGNKDDAIRKRVSGEDDLTRKYLGKMKNMHLQLDPPEDQSIVTLWLGNVEPEINEVDIRSVIYPYGHIAGFHLIRSAKCAFVEYVDRQSAEYAANQLYNALLVHGKPLSVNWAKPRTQAAIESGGNAFSSEQDPSKATLLLPPPGMEGAPRSAYSLPGTSTRPPPPPTSSSSYSGAEEPSAKRARPPPPPGAPGGAFGGPPMINVPSAVQHAKPQGASRGGKGGAGSGQMLYPSMNPSRLGSQN
jgi:pre-mRNA-splicing factor RBM22/SLT11